MKLSQADEYFLMGLALGESEKHVERDTLRLLEASEKIEIIEQMLVETANYDGALYHVYLSCEAGRMLSKPLALQVAERIVHDYHETANKLYGGKIPLSVELKIIRAIPGQDKYQLIR